METLHGVLGMMALIVLVVVLFLRAPRRTHAWEQGRAGGNKRARRGTPALEGRWRSGPGASADERAAIDAANAAEQTWVERAREMHANRARAATAEEATLVDLEAYARAADALTDREDEDPQAAIEAGVKRRFLLVQLAAFSLLDPDEAGLAESLAAKGHERLAGLHRAATRLARYLASEDRIALVGVRPEAPAAVAVLAAPLSLDLFRRGGLVHPPEMAPHRALAQAEAALTRNVAHANATVLELSEAGLRHSLRARVEDGHRLVLHRVTVQR